MPFSTALLTVAGLLAATIAAGLVWRLRDGRRRRPSGVVDVARLGLLRERAALVLFSTETCSRCPQVRRLLRELASERGAIDVHDVDLTHRPDLASENRVLTTPTTLLIGPDARVVARFVGVPRRDAVVAALDELPALEETA